MVTVVKASALIDGTGAEVLRDPIVVMADGRFQDILSGRDLAVPSDAELIDATGYTLLPGLIDSHEHMGLRFERGYERAQMMDSEQEIVFRIAKTAREDIDAGVTSVRTVGDKHHLDVLTKKYIEDGYIPGPRIYPSGAGIRPSHGHGATGTTIADGVDAVRRAVRESVFKGSHHIKLFITGGVGTIGTDPKASYFTQEEIEAAIAEAHRVDRKVLAHIHGGPGATWAIEAGLDSLEHGVYLTDEQILLMKEHGTWHVPTLTVMFHAKDPVGEKLLPREVIEKKERAHQAAGAVIKKSIEAGNKIAAGCDSWHGKVWMEMELLVRFGMTPMEALKAGTLYGAQLLGEEAQIGSVERGKLADLIAVNGNPLDDISCVQDVRLVIKGGEVHRANLE